MGKKRDTGVITGKKREFLREVSRILLGYNGIAQTVANVLNNTYTLMSTRCKAKAFAAKAKLSPICHLLKIHPNVN